MATIGKKFIEPDKWEAAWFSRLSPGQKLLYCYLWERCDHSGVIEIVYPVWSAHIGQEVNENMLNKLIEMVNRDAERMAIYNDKVLLCKYIRFQQKPDKQEPLSGTHGFTKTIVRLLKGHDLYDEVKNHDPVLFSSFESKKGVSELSKPSVSLAQDSPKGLSRSRSLIGSSSGSGSPPRPNLKKREGLADVAERCLKVWPRTSSDVFFSETILAEDCLKKSLEEGNTLEEAQSFLTDYLKSVKGGDVELADALEVLLNDED